MPTTDSFPPFPGIATFIFDTGLYARFQAVDEADDLMLGRTTVDGHCISCNDRSTFSREYQPNTSIGINAYHNSIYSCRWHCSRFPKHSIYICFHLEDGIVSKIGQLPSLADIANDAARSYRNVMDSVDKSELHKAIGLAAHGVGVGSYVYMRRVFERLLMRRQQEASIDNDALRGLRMVERIEAMKEHLPPFLVENKSIYAILSKGIHELTEQECLAFHPILYDSMILILEQDKQRAEDEARRKRLATAISSFSGGTKS